MPPTTTSARRSHAHVVVFSIEMWEDADVFNADALAADNADVLAADTTDVLAADKYVADGTLCCPQRSTVLSPEEPVVLPEEPVVLLHHQEPPGQIFFMS